MERNETTTNVDRLRKLYEAFAVGDIETVLSGMSKDIVWREAENNIYADGNPYMGPDAVVGSVFARIANDWENFNLGDKKYFNVEGNQALVLGRYQGTYRATGNKIDA